jgi:hypothetical protein
MNKKSLKRARFTKIKDIIVYKNPKSYSHNPVVDLLQNGEMVISFREAPRRRMRNHIDMESRGSLIRSKDGGRTWNAAGKTLICEKFGGGIQDPSVRQIKDGTLIANFFHWTIGGQKDFPVNHPWLQTSSSDHYSWTTGVYTSRSTDLGKTWEKPVKVPSPTGDCTSTSDPIIELPNGELLIPIIGAFPGEAPRTIVMRSRDKGKSWGDPSIMAFDPFGVHHFDEPSLLYLPSGKLIAMHRCHRHGETDYGYYLFQTDSDDLGKTWSAPKKTPIWGHPANLLRLRSGRILCVYGHRRPANGVRACLSNDEGETWDIENEFILRADGVDQDVGYPTSTQLKDGTIFTTWYMCDPDKEKQPGVARFSIFSYDSPIAYIGATFHREEEIG